MISMYLPWEIPGKGEISDFGTQVSACRKNPKMFFGKDVSDCIPEKNEKQQASNISTCVFDRKDVFLSPVFSILCGLNRIH